MKTISEVGADIEKFPLFDIIIYLTIIGFYNTCFTHNVFLNFALVLFLYFSF